MKETFGKESGAVVTDDDDLVNHLFNAVHGFLDNPQSAVQSGRKGRKHVLKKFDMHTYVDRMINEYRSSQQTVTAARAQTRAAQTALPLNESPALVSLEAEPASAMIDAGNGGTRR